MINWLRRALLSRVYRKTIKQNSVVHKKESSKKLNIISVILDHRLGIDQEHFKKIGSHFNIPRQNEKLIKARVKSATKHLEQHFERNIDCNIQIGILKDVAMVKSITLEREKQNEKREDQRKVKH